jgi:hypothetical protein
MSGLPTSARGLRHHLGEQRGPSVQRRLHPRGEHHLRLRLLGQPQGGSDQLQLRVQHRAGEIQQLAAGGLVVGIRTCRQRARSNFPMRPSRSQLLAWVVPRSVEHGRRRHFDGFLNVRFRIAERKACSFGPHARL